MAGAGGGAGGGETNKKLVSLCFSNNQYKKLKMIIIAGPVSVTTDHSKPHSKKVSGSIPSSNQYALLYGVLLFSLSLCVCFLHTVQNLLSLFMLN